MVGITGTNGKTTSAFLVRSILESAGLRCGLLGHGQADRRRKVRGGRADDAGGDRPAADVQADARRGRSGLRDGGLLARAGPRPRRRDPLRRRGVHQPDPGPPRLPQRTWRTTSQAKRLLFVPAGAGAGFAPGTAVINVDDPYGKRLARRASAGRRPGPDHLLRRRAPRRPDRPRRRIRRDRHPVHAARSWSCPAASPAACRGTSTSRTPSPRWRRRSPSTSTSTSRSRRWPRPSPCPGGWSRSTSGQDFGVAGRLRPHPRLARERPPRGAAADRRAR